MFRLQYNQKRNNYVKSAHKQNKNKQIAIKTYKIYHMKLIYIIAYELGSLTHQTLIA